MKMRVAVAQLGSARGDARHNANAACGMIERAAAEGCALVVFPECCLTGYIFADRAELETAALDIESAEIARVLDACKTGTIYAVVGLFEKADNNIYNTALLIGPDGIIGRHRKLHLPFLGGDRFVDHPTGTDPSVFSTPIGVIGIAICYEIRFPEIIRTLVLSGAEIVALPTNWPNASHILADHFAPVRAAENFVYFLAANRNDAEAGTEFMGASQIVDPGGAVMTHAGKETGLFAADIDLARSRNKTIVFQSGEFEISPFKDRKPSSYRL
jgi:predicted amidohydrolase